MGAFYTLEEMNVRHFLPLLHQSRTNDSAATVMVGLFQGCKRVGLMHLTQDPIDATGQRMRSSYRTN